LKGTTNIQQKRTGTAKRRLLTRMNTVRSVRSNSPWEADISDSPEENDKMDQENSCVTGNRLTDCDIDADYYY
jgi:hypothetical protein